MNTISLVLNGRTAADIAFLPTTRRSSITTPHRRRPLIRSLSDISTGTISFGSAPPSPILSTSSGATTPRSPVFPPRSGSTTPRPTSSRTSSRRSSKDSSGWYNTENNLTLDDFAKRLNTRSKKFEIWQGRCAQNVVMALLRPTPLILFALNPICLVIWVIIAYLYFSSKFPGYFQG